MLNLTPHRRFHIPNGLAVVAAVLLIGSSLVSINAAPKNTLAMDDCDKQSLVTSVEQDISIISDNVKQNSHVLKLGLQLFQR